jgi:hypothetical protein
VIFNGRLEVSGGGFDTAPDAAEDVDLPGGIKADLEQIGGLWGYCGPNHGAATRLTVGVGAGGVDGRPLGGNSDAAGSAGLQDALLGESEVKIGVGGTRNEGIEFGVIERLPPLADRYRCLDRDTRLRGCGGRGCLRHSVGAPLCRHVQLRRLEIGTDRTTDHHQHDGQSHAQALDHGPASWAHPPGRCV